MKELTTSAEHWRRCIFLDFWRLIAAVWSLPRNPQYSDCPLLDPVVQNLPNILKCSFLFQNPKVRWRSPIYLLVWLQKQWKVLTGELVTVGLSSRTSYILTSTLQNLQLFYDFNSICTFSTAAFLALMEERSRPIIFPPTLISALQSFWRKLFQKKDHQKKCLKMQPHPNPAPASFCPLCTSDLCQWLYQQWSVQQWLQWLPQKPIEGFTSFPQWLFFSSKLKALFVINYSMRFIKWLVDLLLNVDSRFLWREWAR